MRRSLPSPSRACWTSSLASRRASASSPRRCHAPGAPPSTSRRCGRASTSRGAAYPHVATGALSVAITRAAAGQIASLRLPFPVFDFRGCGASIKPASLRNLDLRDTPWKISESQHCAGCFYIDVVNTVLGAVTGLVRLELDVQGSVVEIRALLVSQGEYSVVHLRRLVVKECPTNQVALLARDLRLHPTLRELGVSDSPLDTPSVVAIVDAVIASDLAGLFFTNCSLGPQAVTHLARLLRDATRLFIQIDIGLCDADSSPLLASSLRSSSLSVLCLEGIDLLRDPGVRNVVIAALVGHPTLREISLAYNGFTHGPAAAGACLSRLVTANLPRLHTLSLANCRASDAGTRPIFAALLSNTNLRTCFLQGNLLSAPFARDVVLPSVRANTSLRRLQLAGGTRGEGEPIPELTEAEALVAARR